MRNPKGLMPKAVGPMALVYKGIEEWLISSPRIEKILAIIPDWFIAGIVAFSVAAWWFDPLRVRLWSRLTDHFEVRSVIKGEPLSAKGNIMSVEANLRFRKPTKGHLWLRVFAQTGLGKLSRETVIDLGEVDEPKGGTKRIEIARRHVAYPGWEPKQDTWGGESGEIAGFDGLAIAVIELTGAWPTQKHKVLVISPNYCGNETRPSVYGISENVDVWRIENEHRK